MSVRRSIPLALALLMLAGRTPAQRPFYTDDAEVTPSGRWHLEVSNQLSALQHAARPALRQNTTDVEVDVGVLRHLELSIECPLITLVRARTRRPGERSTVVGIGDTNLGAKYTAVEERPDSRIPALAVGLALELPTGDTARGLGSGLIDVALDGIAQKALTERLTARVNAGLKLLGDDTTGALGSRSRGVGFIGGLSLVRHMTGPLDLGAEVTGTAAPGFRARHGELQVQAAGTYTLCDGLALDVGVIRGFEPASPRVAVQVGILVDF